MEEFVKHVMSIKEPRILLILCGIFLFADVLTGYLKAFKTHQVNSSISRDGYLKKISWMIALLLGFGIDFLIHTSLFLIGSTIVCVATEGISIYENFGELGIRLPFAKYFEKLKDMLR